MLKIQNSATKKIRVAQIVFFIIQVLLTTQPFYRALDDDGAIVFISPIRMISFIGARQDGEFLTGINNMGLLSIIFIALPVIALGFQIFDFYYNLKNVAGFLVSAGGIISIIYFVTPAYLASGSLLTLLLYILTAFLSVFGMLARYMKTKNVTVEKK